jgi:uncharacterized protein (TIGR03000 family)
MTKFVGLAALGLVALFMAPPQPAAARSVGIGGIRGIGGIGRIGGIGGIGSIGRPWALIGWRGYGPVGWARYPHVHGVWRANYYYPYGGGSYYPSDPVYVPEAAVSYSYYPQEQPQDVNTVLIRMRVPGDALVWIEDQATSQRGADRDFLSPSLVPGREYVYHIRVQWDDNGKVVERTRAVTVHAGDRVNLTIDK